MRRNPGFDLADQAFSRTAGAELVPGNRVRLLRDAAENYPAWIRAIEGARDYVYFETYIFTDDAIGRQFADVLTRKAKQGVRVCLAYDWLGSLWRASRGFWRRLAANGIEVRCFNPPSFESPFAWVSRDHRKTISVDGRIAYVSGLCVGQHWAGYPARGIDPWRDTGIEIEGPAVADIDRAFAEVWSKLGTPLDPEPAQRASRNSGDVSLRVIGSVPAAGGVYRLDQLITALARRSIWLSDAYFAGTSSYIHAMRSAAHSGVDIRLLIPGVSDVPLIRAISRAGLRPLLEAGVRVFEWNGTMMHAKTAVVDGRWARVGSTNLNLSSWIGNWELDVVVEDERFAQQMEEMFLEDLANSTEIVLRKGRWRPTHTERQGPRPAGRTKSGSAGRTAAGVMRLGRTVSAAISRQRELGPAEGVIMLWGAALLVFTAAVCVIWPRVLAYPLAGLCLWLALSLVAQAVRLRSKRRKTEEPTEQSRAREEDRHRRQER